MARELVAPTLGVGCEQSTWSSSTQVHTRHDAAAGEALHARFSQSFGGHGLVIEDRADVSGDGVHCWHVDPIDGSANHLRGIPYVSLTAGLLRDGQPVVGVIHDVLRNRTLVAHRGGGAQIVRDGVAHTLRMDSTKRLSDAMAIVHIARRGPLMGREGALQRLLWNVRKIRCMGSIALDLALVAAGEADLLVAGRGRPHRLLDVLGGLVVLQEAGGATVSADGLRLSLHAKTLVAGSPSLCAEFAELMANLDLEGFDASEAAPPG